MVPLDRLGHYSRVRERMNTDGDGSEAAIYSTSHIAYILSINASNTDKDTKLKYGRNACDKLRSGRGGG
jgi:hypothetical protein